VGPPTTADAWQLHVTWSAQLQIPRASSNSNPAAHALTPLSTPSRQFLNARQLLVEYNPVASDGHASQDGEVTVAVVGLVVVAGVVGV
jgi:hypothetical protein